jgi:hypothetical protein
MCLSDHSRERLATEVSDNIFRNYHPYRDDAQDFLSRTGRQVFRFARAQETQLAIVTSKLPVLATAVITLAKEAHFVTSLSNTLNQRFEHPPITFTHTL